MIIITSFNVHSFSSIDKMSMEKIESYIADSEKAGAVILLDGRSWKKNEKLAKSHGFWVGPTVILHKKKTDKALHDEIFGPVISVFECKTKEEAIEIENGNPYGNAACIYTTTGSTAEWFTKRFSAGMLGVNIGVPVPREPFSFGGINASKFGDHDITGDGGVSFFTQRIKVLHLTKIHDLKLITLIYLYRLPPNGHLQNKRLGYLDFGHALIYTNNIFNQLVQQRR